jgi:peptide/nickel transport system permease protein
MAIGAAIPIETICDVPGLGRLAWQAATARDLPLLVNLTMLVALITIAAAALAEAMTPAETTARREGALSP